MLKLIEEDLVNLVVTRLNYLMRLYDCYDYLTNSEIRELLNYDEFDLEDYILYGDKYLDKLEDDILEILIRTIDSINFMELIIKSSKENVRKIFDICSKLEGKLDLNVSMCRDFSKTILESFNIEE